MVVHKTHKVQRERWERERSGAMETGPLGIGLQGSADTSHAAVKQEQKRSNDDSDGYATTDHDRDHGHGHAVSDYQQQHREAMPFKHDELESAKAEMRQVMEENQRLKSFLEQAAKDYRALQMKFYEFPQKESEEYSTDRDNNPESELVSVSLSLGRPSGSCIDPKSNSYTISNSATVKEASRVTNTAAEETEEESRLPALGLDCKYDPASPGVVAMNSSNETSFNEAASETWPAPSRNILIKNTARSSGSDDEVVQQPHVKKPRVCVRARCDTATMNDGCQWRKYGQKIAKGNPCPRAYYRCTVAPTCPVRKQVQRCADDMSILITTYEGTHNHPLPVSATAMASTTSAAAYMLISGSSTSSGLGSNLSATTTGPTPIPSVSTATPGVGFHHGFNFSLPNHSRSPTTFFLPASSSISSPSPSRPTITLDLTSSTPSSSSSQLTGRPTFSSIFTPTYSSTNLMTFNSSELLSSNSLPINWPNGSLSLRRYASHSQPFNSKTQVVVGSSMDTGRNPGDGFYQTLFRNQKGGTMIGNPSNQSTYPDTIAATAKALTSALPKGNITGSSCDASFLGITAPSTTSPPSSAGSFMFLSNSPLMPFPASKGTSSASGGDNKYQAISDNDHPI